MSGGGEITPALLASAEELLLKDEEFRAQF